MKHFLILINFLFCIPSLFAQPQSYTLSLYYEINETSSKTNFQRLDSCFSQTDVKTYKINIYGYADFLSGNDYNLKLSQKRADLVKNYLLKASYSPSISILHCEGKGETNSQDNTSLFGDPQQRKVDVVFTKEFPIKKIGNRENLTQAEIKKEPSKNNNNLLSGKKSIASLDKGESLAIEGLSFIPGRHVLVKEAIPILEELLETLKEYPNLKIEIQGHICCEVDNMDGLDHDTQEMNLSENRALAIYNYLVRNGIDEDRLTYKGYGHTQPKIKIEKSPADEQMNRRVEFKVLEN
jgi:outer membrane protein OmpA-like peptidoglycan-associated protein